MPPTRAPIGPGSATTCSPRSTAIRARAQMVDRAARRSATLADGEREAMLANLAAVEAGVAAILLAVDGIGDDTKA